MDEQLK